VGAARRQREQHAGQRGQQRAECGHGQRLAGAAGHVGQERRRRVGRVELGDEPAHAVQGIPRQELRPLQAQRPEARRDQHQHGQGEPARPAARV